MDDSCVLMFSGGRDSTLATARLANSGKNLILVTVTSQHLEGISTVQQRLIELKFHLSQDTPWILLQDSNIKASDLYLSARTCLPCFLKYTSLGIIIARKFNASSLAFGFTKYQSGWPEQTPYAISKFRKILSHFGIRLEIPVYDILSKEDAIEQLQALGLNSSALEQKCSRQTINEELPLSVLEKAIDEWSEALLSTISANLGIDPLLITTIRLGDFI